MRKRLASDVQHTTEVPSDTTTFDDHDVSFLLLLIDVSNLLRKIQGFAEDARDGICDLSTFSCGTYFITSLFWYLSERLTQRRIVPSLSC